MTSNMAMAGRAFVKCGRILINKQVLPVSGQNCRCLSVCTSDARVPPNYRRSNGSLDTRLYQVPVRHMSDKRNFIADFIDNIKQEIAKSKEMKDSLKKFREEADKLEQSDALKKAREKYESIESETFKGTDVLKKRFSDIQEKVSKTLEDVEKTEYAQRGKKMVEEFGKTAERATESISKGTQTISETKVYKSVSDSVKVVKEELDNTAFSQHRLYRPPQTLRRRDQSTYKESEDKPVEADTESTGIVMHKDSKWFESWQNFKDNNQYVNKMFDLKTKYDESDHIVVRATRTFTDKFSELFGGMFQKTEMSEVLTEIIKMDPTFDKEKFIKECQSDIIPNVLEAIVRGDLEVLKDWCHEAAFNIISHPIKQAQQMGLRIDSRVLDISHVDIAMGKIMDQGPVLIITFTAQQIMAVRNSKGEVVEGDEDKIMRVFYVWALCRDQTILDPKAAWRIVDLSSTPAEQWL